MPRDDSDSPVEVRFTRGPLGVMLDLDQTRFEPKGCDVQIGDRGLRMQPHPTLDEPGWWIIAVGDYLCPAHESQFEVLDVE